MAEIKREIAYVDGEPVTKEESRKLFKQGRIKYIGHFTDHNDIVHHKYVRI